MKNLIVLVVVFLMSCGIAFAEWKGDITLGGNLKSGNEKKVNLSLGAKAVQKIGKERYSGSFLYNYAEQDNELTARNIYGSVKYDHFLTEKKYGYISLEMLKDNFKNLNLRAIVGPGLGYQVWEDNLRSFSVEAGLAYFSEDVKIGEDNQWVTARLGSNFSQKLSKVVTISNSLTINPSLKEFKEYKLRSESSLTSTLSENWNVKLSKIWQYDSEPSAGIQNTDMTWILGLQYDF